ncbi:MAG: DNA-directed RNA polymerase subunit omega [Thermoleophilia bacterium]|nr:DNA-directed RNA polymerase subunit omega [Thermoleophilia bacterium]
MLYGRRLDQALEHVDGSRYALVHAVSKRARQITLWLTADPAELRAEAAPPPAAGELVTRDPVALSEAEILQGEVRVKWDPSGRGDDLGEQIPVVVDPLDETILLESLGDDDDDADLGAEEEGDVTPALAQVLEGEAAAEDEEEDEEEAEEAEADEEDEETTDDDLSVGDDLVDVSLDEMGEEEAAENDEDEDI